MVRIAAPILDNLVNLVDETSISRSRIEQQLHQFHALLEEMETTVTRFHDQVRRLSMETEAHTLPRSEAPDITAGAEDFDPLEMDRYSHLQQLARGLEESASDLQDLKDTLLDKAQDTETLLVQQARVNRDLHENLTLTRMVPFARVVPRLRRIVRQTASELDKPIELQLDNVEGEMDRAVLERIVPSLEHLIRNAIDHGIESPERRRLAGKPETGTVAITFAREAGDIVIRLSDDGRGLDLEAIRAKAASLRLLPSGDELTDQDVMQLIFRPGFSTSQAVSQISGRGLGMDVVDNEVRQLGGSVALTSRRNYGTEFTLRLPFTASVNRALLMKADGELYGVLLNSVAGVVKLNNVELASLHADPEQRLHFEGEFYKVCPLTSLLDGVPATLPAAAGKLSVLLVKGKSDNVAVQVDALEPSQEIVVKSLGPQFAKVRGLAGATLLGDGRVVPIVDLVALIADRGSWSHALPQPALSGPGSLASAVAAPARAATIVVVDDSVTVRKATSRLLERNGYRVLTARDGLEAMQLLQEVKPDLMLLDIEMPRMDGFEVARQVRASELLRGLPIAMITSRSGDKHREKALTLGVNRYLGKPYQEEVLLSVVEELLAEPPRRSVKVGVVAHNATARAVLRRALEELGHVVLLDAAPGPTAALAGGDRFDLLIWVGARVGVDRHLSRDCFELELPPTFMAAAEADYTAWKQNLRQRIEHAPRVVGDSGRPAARAERVWLLAASTGGPDAVERFLAATTPGARRCAALCAAPDRRTFSPIGATARDPCRPLACPDRKHGQLPPRRYAFHRLS